MKFYVFRNVKQNQPACQIELKTLRQVCQSWDTASNVNKFRETKDASFKHALPAITPMGTFQQGAEKVRAIKNMVANGITMIDLDHLGTHEEIVEICCSLVKDKSDVLQAFRVMLIHITPSGEGLRILCPTLTGYTQYESACRVTRALGFPEEVVPDKSIKDISRLSFLPAAEDIFYLMDTMEGEICGHTDASEWEKYAKSEAKPKEEVKPSEEKKDSQNVPFARYTEAQISENDALYANFKYKGRPLAEIVQVYVTWKTRGMGPEAGERHALYNNLCRNFRNCCDNDPRILHAILPSLNHPLDETWRQCCYYTSLNNNGKLPKDFYFWMKDRSFLDYPSEDENDQEPEELRFYRSMVDTMPALPPVIREYVKIAPLWFKLPTISVLEAYLGLLATNYRSYYLDGFPVSLSFYNIVYAPAGSGKSFAKRMEKVLENTAKRDKLALMKAQIYDEKVRKKNGSGENPDEVEWKQRVIAAKTSLGEILKRQKAQGRHHWLMDVSEFSIWAATIKKNKEEWSAFYRTSYDNEEFSQSYQSSNSFRGRVPVYPIIHARCTVGQLHSFFTNVEDGLLTRFDFTPLLNQRFADFQIWKNLTDRDILTIDKTIDRLESETYMDVAPDVNPDTAKASVVDDEKIWDYELKEPFDVDMTFCIEPLREWLRGKLLEASKGNNDALDTFRRRCARHAFMFAMLCRALWGKSDKSTQKKIIDAMLWRAEWALFYMRFLWEHKLIEELQKTERLDKGMRNQGVFNALGAQFSKTDLKQMLTAKGFSASSVYVVINNWKTLGLIKEGSKGSYKKN